MTEHARPSLHAQDQCATGLAHAARQLHEEFDPLLGSAEVDACITEVTGRFADATVLSFVPLLVRRYVREELQRRPRTIDLREHHAQPAVLTPAD